MPERVFRLPRRGAILDLFGGHLMTHPNDTIPYGFCHCGCGRKTAIATRTNLARGVIKGQPSRYLPGHSVPFRDGLDFLTRPDLPPLVESRIDRSGGPDACWPYRGPLSNGYGHCYIPGTGKNMAAHRFMLMRKVGRVLRPDEFACHHCDNPPCCNPAHLFVGTCKDNMLDAARKGRTASGDHNPARRFPERLRRGAEHPLVINPLLAEHGADRYNAKLTEDAVRDIRERREAGEKRRTIAATYGITETLVYLVATRKAWSHVD